MMPYAMDDAPERSVSPPPEGATHGLPLATTVGHLLRRAQQAHTAIWSQEFGGELTGPQYAVLSVLGRRLTLDQSTTGNLASLDKSTTADVLARLKRNGWLASARNTTDARRNDVSLTAAARAALREITPRVMTVQNRLLAPLEEGRRQPFTAALTVMAFAGDAPIDDAMDSHANSLSLATAPGHLIRRAEQLHRQHWTQRVGAELTAPQYAVLSCLSWNPSLDQRTAGELTSLDKASMVDIIHRLGQRKLLTTDRDDADRRRKRLTPTEAALRLLAEVTPAVAQVQSDLLEPLARRRIPNLLDGLHAVAYRTG